MKNNPYLAKIKYCIFDIETMGLRPNSDMVICSSFYDPETGKTCQVFCDEPLLEAQVLRETVERLNSYEAVVTYNGNSFDLPFIAARCEKYGIEKPDPLLWRVDVYRWLKKYWQMAPMMQSLRQKAVEEALGVSKSRTDEIDGGECISLYSRFLQLGEEDAKEKILLHNGDDVRQLAAVCSRINFLPWHMIAFDEGFLISDRGERALVRTSCFKRNRLSVKALAQPGKLPASFYAEHYSLEYDSITGETELSLSAEQGADLLFADLDALPVNSSDFAALSGFHDGFLVLCEDGKINYRECNALSSALIKTVF